MDVVFTVHDSVAGVMVSIVAFQAVDPGSIPGRRMTFCRLVRVHVHGAGLAQLVERWSHNPKVASSILAPGILRG